MLKLFTLPSVYNCVQLRVFNFEIPVILAEVIDHTSGLSFHGRLFEDIL